jgi:hypothetical protein
MHRDLDLLPDPPDHVTPGGVSVLGPDDAWLAGSTTGEDIPRVYHWDGVSWSPVSIPDLGGGVRLQDIVAFDDGDVWVVGVPVWPPEGADTTLVSIGPARVSRWSTWASTTLSSGV